MGKTFRGVVLCLFWGLAGAILALVPGLIWVNWAIQSARFEGSAQMGMAVLVGYVLMPLGFLLGAAAGGVSIWRARRKVRPHHPGQ